jgi:hypothetical protein
MIKLIVVLHEQPVNFTSLSCLPASQETESKKKLAEEKVGDGDAGNG